MTQRVLTSELDIACDISGPPDAPTAVLLHGFPYDQHCYDAVVPLLNAAGLRTVVPCLRGHGGTRFLSPDTPRAGQQAAIGHDLLELLDALSIGRAIVAGFDWGGRAACVAAALWPARVAGLVTCCGYQIQDIAGATVPADPQQEQRFWYQYYFHTERGRNGLATRRAELCRLLWRLWSPTWHFDEATWQRSAPSFDNPDFVEVVLHSYRHRMGNAAGAARYAETEARLAALPRITVPTIAVHGDADGVNPPHTSENHARFFTGPYERRVLAGVGHNPPQEAPRLFADAVLALRP
jgi:pimeloyl-ACP methyl ester carboxylesterase